MIHVAVESSFESWVVLGFDFNPSTGDLTYALIKKSWIMPIESVWSGIGNEINSCRGGG
jgi:hypothetical protein